MPALTAHQLVQALAARGVDVSRAQPLNAVHAKCGDGVVVIGRGQPALEFAVFPAVSSLTATDAKEIWRARQAGRPNPLVLVLASAVADDARSMWVGVDPASLTVVELAWSQVAALGAGALREPSGPAAVRYLEHAVPRPGEDAIPGLNNLGMFATYMLTERVPSYEEWKEPATPPRAFAELRGRPLLEALGFRIDNDTGSPVELLRGTGDRAAAVAVFLDQGESADTPLTRLGTETPIGAALARAERDNIRFVFIASGDKLRLHVTGDLHGVGRKGPAETFVEVDMSLLHRDQLGYVPLIFSVAAIAEGGTFQRILAESRDYSAKLSERLRERIYVDVVPELAVSVAAANPEDTLDDVYEQALVLLFRLLFLAYAEDRDLLPYRRNDRYRHASLKALARELADLVEEGQNHDGDSTTALWARINSLFEAIDKGSPTWDIPAYNGGLFSKDEAVNEAGAALAAIELTNEQLGRALTSLLVEPGGDLPAAPIDFRSLSVRDFGTIYEGLLESGISEAPEDLALDKRGNYVPAGNQAPVVLTGEIYHHNRGGARKSTGSYFTKDFAVEHLLEKALVPAIDGHLDRLRNLALSGDLEQASDQFFDFRCADIAMGSGHFLVAAVDTMEQRFSAFLAEYPIPGVLAELDRLHAAAVRGLGESAPLYEIERRALLRRQIARRCIYGVDVNRIAVELAQLGLWVHTFVPGLALTYLGHNLVHGNGLTGIGTIEEAADAFDHSGGGGTISVFLKPIRELLTATIEPLRRLARANDATRDDMQVVYAAQREAERSAEPARMLFDLICAERRGEISGVEFAMTEEAVREHPGLDAAAERSARLQALHFPVAFPEVFLREDPGFDCVLGNPPWEEATVEKLGFWALRFPGLRSMKPTAQRERLEGLQVARPDLITEYESELSEAELVRSALAAGPFPGMGTGDPDLYKAFAWRFWGLMRGDGKAGVVLPRSALFAAGSAKWREAIFDRGGWQDVTTLLNNRQWVFDEVHPQYTVGLVVLGKGESDDDTVTLSGPFRSRQEMAENVSAAARTFASADVRSWVPGAGLPLFPGKDSAAVFQRLVAHPRLGDQNRSDGWRVRPHREFDATNDKGLMIFSDERPAPDSWPVYGGRSFNLWTPDTGQRYAWADPEVVLPELRRLRASRAKRSNSVFSEMPPDWIVDPATISCLVPRIAFRDITRATDSRTMITALVPGQVILTNKAPYFLWPRGTDNDEAYLLGVLSSIPLDWYARRVIELGMNYHALNGFPIPAPDPADVRRIEIERLAASLSRRAPSLAAWAPEIEPLNVSDEDQALAHLDALVASLYGLSRTDVVHVFETFHDKWNHTERLDRVLAHFDAI